MNFAAASDTVIRSWRDAFGTNMRDFLGGIAIMVGLGFAGWGLLFLVRFPEHGQGKAAIVLGLCAILIGIILIFPASRDSD